MEQPSKEQVSALREQIIAWQNAERPRGMPPSKGLLYQPIPFDGLEDLACERNSSHQRFEMLRDTGFYKDARVLDLGCANGYFLFCFAKQAGCLAKAIGVDYFGANVKSNQAVASVFGLDDRLSFQQETISEALLETMTTAHQFDVGHLLSVHHHLIRSLGIEETWRIFHLLWQRIPVFFVEQGSLTQEEYQQFTGRDEPFSTNSFSRLISMLTACGIPESHCFPVGMGYYLSGNRDDFMGSGRVIVGVAQNPGNLGTRNILRKAHKNGIYMELLEVGGRNGGTEVWKNVVTGNSLAKREGKALRILADEPGYPKFLDEKQAEQDMAGGLLRMRGLRLREVTEQDLQKHGSDLRKQAVAHLQTLACKGLIHNEINELHLLIDENNQLILLDFETVYFLSESRGQWKQEVFDPNPALGVGRYPRDIHECDWRMADLLAMDALFEVWGMTALSETEKQNYLEALEQN